MEARRLHPVLLVGGITAVAVLMVTQQAGGDSVDAWVLIICASVLALGAILLGSDSDDEVTVQSSTAGESSDSSSDSDSQTQSKSELPDPLDEGYDMPLF